MKKPLTVKLNTMRQQTNKSNENDPEALLRSLRSRIAEAQNEGLVITKTEIKRKNIAQVKGAENLNDYCDKIKNCALCGLHKTRTKFVFGEGDPHAKLMFIGEAPGADEDLQGRPFVGKAGQLLTKIIEAIKFKREEVFIANILKCRPPDNRPPEPEEAEKCFPYLARQIELVKPLIICTLGNPSTQNILNTKEGITKLRGKIFDYKGIMVIPIYHPSALLRNPLLKDDTWKDVKFLRSQYDKLCGSSN